MVSRFLVMTASGFMASTGQALKMSDENTTGSDDVAGELLVVGATALQAYATSNDKGFRKALRAVADSINAFLGDTPTGSA